jgi:rRNA 2'-O-methyltransferase fibrillarin
MGINAKMFVKNRGYFCIAIKASCIDSTLPPETVYAHEAEKLREEKLRPFEQLSLEPYERDHLMISGMYRPEEEDLPKRS